MCLNCLYFQGGIIYYLVIFSQLDIFLDFITK